MPLLFKSIANSLLGGLKRLVKNQPKSQRPARPRKVRAIQPNGTRHRPF